MPDFTIAAQVQPPKVPDIMEGYSRAMALRNMMQQQQMGAQQLEGAQLENQQREQQVTDSQAMTAAMKEWDGTDVNKLPGLAVKHGASANAVMSLKTGVLKQQQDAANLTKDQHTIETQNNDYLAQAIENVQKLPPEQQAAGLEQAKATAVQGGRLDPKMAQSMQYQGPEQLDSMKKLLMGHGNVLKAAEAQTTIDKNIAQTGEANARTKQIAGNTGAEWAGNQTKAIEWAARMLPGAKSQVQWEQGLSSLRANGFKPEEMGIPLQYSPEAAQQVRSMAVNPAQPVAVDQAEMRDWLAKNPGKGPADFMKAKAQIVPAFNFNMGMNAGGGLSDEALNQAADRYFMTGQLPPMSRGQAGLAQQRAIINRSAEMHPGANLAANSAEFAANKASLTGLQKSRDAVVAFESTAGKNLDIFLNTAKKVIDSGSPWINTPLRAVATGGLGSADVAAYNAARQVAINEIAKVTSNPNLTGQLSDSARKEVEAFIPANATLVQAYRVAEVLKQDMSNRRIAYDEQLADIKNRTRTATGPSPVQSKGRPPLSSFEK